MGHEASGVVVEAGRGRMGHTHARAMQELPESEFNGVGGSFSLRFLRSAQEGYVRKDMIEGE
ncbi:hypothetical protein ES705_47958 [subsurface metagenome]